MSRVAQIGIALGLLGVMLTLMGLFPGVTGIEPTDTIGIIQIVTILVGLALLILGGLIFVKFTFYARKSATLAQQIAIRLALTGIVFATISGLADVMGFGSNLSELGSEILLGPLQAVGLLSSFLLASVGVLMYALNGEPELTAENAHDEDEFDDTSL
jgi:hypothetical protein